MNENDTSLNFGLVCTTLKCLSAPRLFVKMQNQNKFELFSTLKWKLLEHCINESELCDPRPFLHATTKFLFLHFLCTSRAYRIMNNFYAHVTHIKQ